MEKGPRSEDVQYFSVNGMTYGLNLGTVDGVAALQEQLRLQGQAPLTRTELSVLMDAKKGAHRDFEKQEKFIPSLTVRDASGVASDEDRPKPARLGGL